MPIKPPKNRRSNTNPDQNHPRLTMLMQQFEQKISRMQVLMDIGNALNSTLELDRLFDMIVESATRELQAALGSLMILEKDFLTIKAARGMNKKLTRKIRIKVGESVTGWVAKHAQPLLIDDITQDKRFQIRRGKKRYAGNSCLSVPIIHKEEVLGVLNCTDKTDGGVFTEEDLDFMITLASQAAVAIVNARMLDHIRKMADHDTLTGLYNHHSLIERLSEETERADRYRTKPVSLVMIDIDFFKKVNDTYGHQAGNQVLKALADKLVKLTRRVDIICRYGGEEFVIILPEINITKALICTERIRRAVEKMRVKTDDTVISITISMGISCYPENCADSKKLINYADQALYHAKNDGRNCIRVCDPAKQELSGFQP
jgi:diguanylate cyclase (GGDEF)-like protein